MKASMRGSGTFTMRGVYGALSRMKGDFCIVVFVVFPSEKNGGVIQVDV